MTHRIRSSAFTLTILLPLLWFLSPLQAMAKSGALIFGVHPYLHATTLIDRFTPLTAYLEGQLHRPIKIRIATSYQDHIDAIRNGEVDFAYIGPASYAILTYDNDHSPLLGRLSFLGNRRFRGAIITTTNSKLTTLSDLHGKRFAFGDPNSTLSTLIPRQMLQDAGVGLKDLAAHHHLKNHHNVALSVLMGKYDAGGVKEEVFREYEARGLKVLQWSAEIPTHAFVASASIAPDLRQEIITLLQTLHLQPDASAILDQIKKGTTAIIAASSEEYDPLRRVVHHGLFPDTPLPQPTP
ncbi:MAG: phosphate/phosphite/phosphonate ABC transporter substrate-binding protein [Gammaproteobacteria bacterium]|nr:phosphate/phosphite/phosphonate ABC transporter substrate-binding protein [Gammaproteobacteria bacterium]